MKRILALFLSVLLTLTVFTSCKKNKKEETEPAVDLRKYTVATTKHYEITAAMYAFFLYDQIGQNSSYLQYYGYDTSLSITEQTSKCAFDETKTWFEYFCESTNEMIDQYVAAANAAIDAGMSLTDEEKKDLDDTVKQLNDYALQSGYAGIDEYLAEMYVYSVDEQVLRKCIEIQQLGYNYMNEYYGNVYDTEHPIEELEKYREEHPEEFLKADYVYYNFFGTYDKDATEEEMQAAFADAKKRAEEFAAQYTTLESFKNAIVEAENEGREDPYEADVILDDYVIVGELYSAEGAADEDVNDLYEWMYSSDRKAGDMYIGEDKYYDDVFYTVFFLVTPAYYDDYVTNSVHHILYGIDTTLTGDELEEAYEAARVKAQATLDGFLNGGDVSYEAFEKLAEECKKDTENVLEASKYENVPLDYMVAEFEEWLYDEARKPGDTGLVKTTYGYHIMYFIEDGLPVWQSTAHGGYSNDLASKHLEDIQKTYPVEYDQTSVNMIP